MRKALLLFAVVALAQWAVPLGMIVRKEGVVRDGVAYRFRLRPVDPRDPFRGDYVTLRFAAFDGTFTIPEGIPEEGPIDAFAVLDTDSEGFAHVTGLAQERPASGDHVRVTATAYRQEIGGWPMARDVGPSFTRYYLREGGGRVVERLLQERARGDGTLDAYAVVRVRQGEGVIEDLVVGGRSVSEWMEEELPAQEAGVVDP